MMEDETSSFRLGSGPIDEVAETPVADEGLQQVQIKKVARRSRLTALLLLVLMLLMFAWGYWDLLGRFDRQANSGNREIKNITAVFDDRLNELESQFAAIEKQRAADTAKFDKISIKLQSQTGELQNSIGELQKNMDAIDLSGTMRKEKKAMLAQMKKTFAPVKADIDKLSKDLGTFDERVRSQLVPLEQKLNQTRDELTRLDKSFKTTSGEHINRDDMALELLKVKKSYQQKIVTETAAIRKQASLLTERLERLESRVRAISRTAPASPAATTTSPGSNIQEQNLP